MSELAYEITEVRSTSFRLNDDDVKAVAEISLSVYDDDGATGDVVYTSAIKDEDGETSYIASKESMFENIINGATISDDMLLFPIIMADGIDSDNEAFSTEYAEAFRYASYLCYHLGVCIDNGWVPDPLDGLMPEVLRATIYKIHKDDEASQTVFQFGNLATTTENLVEGLGSLVKTSINAVHAYQKALGEPISSDEEALQMILDVAKAKKLQSEYVE